MLRFLTIGSKRLAPQLYSKCSEAIVQLHVLTCDWTANNTRL